MRARGLKTKIAISISSFLLLGMLSIDIVTMMTAQRSLIRAEVSKGQVISKVLGDYMLAHAIWDDSHQTSDAKARLAVTLRESGVACFSLVDRNQNQIVFGANRCGAQGEILALTQQALSAGVESIHFIGSTFGFFWVQHEHLIVSTPLRINGELVAGFSLTFSLENIYRSLRHSQQMLFLYIFVNTAVLSFLGIYRIFKLYLQPLTRLAQRAEDYKENDEVLFVVRKEDNELQRLSTALNSLLRRLSAEKEKLRGTVSSLERANAELRKAQTEIIRAEKLATVGRLSAGIAHEIGNPIGIVTGYLGLLKQRDIPDDERIEYLDRAEKEIERISAIIRQLLEISRPSRGGPQTLPVHALLQEMEQVLKVQPFMSHVRLSCDLAALEDTVMADSNQLRQVFLNLVINAADAISSKGPDSCGDLIITTDNAAGPGFASRNSRGWLHIRFSDDGIGIPEETQANIFDPFFTTKDPGKGTGLGLSVSIMIVESVGGTMNVKSEGEKGTIMTVSLPLVATAPGCVL